MKGKEPCLWSTHHLPSTRVGGSVYGSRTHPRDRSPLRSPQGPSSFYTLLKEDEARFPSRLRLREVLAASSWFLPGVDGGLRSVTGPHSSIEEVFCGRVTRLRGPVIPTPPS